MPERVIGHTGVGREQVPGAAQAADVLLAQPFFQGEEEVVIERPRPLVRGVPPVVVSAQRPVLLGNGLQFLHGFAQPEVFGQQGAQPGVDGVHPGLRHGQPQLDPLDERVGEHRVGAEIDRSVLGSVGAVVGQRGTGQTRGDPVAVLVGVLGRRDCVKQAGQVGGQGFVPADVEHLVHRVVQPEREFVLPVVVVCHWAPPQRWKCLLASRRAWTDFQISSGGPRLFFHGLSSGRQCGRWRIRPTN